MARIDNDNVLALPPMKSEFDTSASISLARQTRERALSRTEQRIIEISSEQRAVIELTSANARFGLTQIGKIHEQGIQIFDNTTAFTIDIKNQPGRDNEHQAYIDQISQRLIQLHAQHTLAIIDVSAANIGMEVHRSLFPDPSEVVEIVEIPRQPGFFERLFGKSK